MALWRCMNEECEQQGFEFESDSNRCPHCKMHWSVSLVAVHYLVPAEGPIKTPLGNRMIACDPAMKRLPQSASGSRGAVTCPKCKISTIFVEDERDDVNNYVPCIEQRIAIGH